MTRPIFLCVSVLLCLLPARGAELRISQAALEHTLVASLFSGPDGRAYLRGGPGKSGCPVSLDSPKLTLDGRRILLHLHAVASIGTTVHGRCLGINLVKDVDVSMLPAAEGQSIAFTDVRLDRLSGSRELDFLLMPFLSRQIPSSLKVDAAWLLGKALENSRERTGYAIKLDRLVVHSVTVESTHLLVDVDGDLSID
jgi:hypothetical protein